MAASLPDPAVPLLSVRDLTVEFATERGYLPVVSDVSFDVPEGSVVGLVGESGSGKSVTCFSVLRLIETPPGRITSGQVLFRGRDLLTLPERQIQDVRGNEISMIFQEPMTSLNPAFTVGAQIAETVRRHRGGSRKAATERAVEVLDLVGIPRARDRVRDYPHQFSGGMRQRVMIAMALSTEPELLIADEPTTALDVTIQAEVLDLLRDLGARFGMGVLLVTHDLGVVADICDRVVVMYAGQVVERAEVDDLFAAPRHPYTEGLMRSLPSVEGPDELHVIPGSAPLPWAVPPGCRFAARCAHAVPGVCTGEPLLLADAGPGRVTRCARAGELVLGGTR
ncbi:ABC transporter ATP-binding protein [Blastococcus sp. SYSU D00820]